MPMCLNLQRSCAALELLLVAAALVTVFAERTAHGLSLAGTDLQRPEGGALEGDLGTTNSSSTPIVCVCVC